MTIFQTLERAAKSYRAARRRFITERQLQALPFDIQKDIGWPPIDHSVADERW